MKKLTVKKIIDFTSKGDRAKKNFAIAVKQNKPEPKKEGKGGHYWAETISAIIKAYKSNNAQIISEKIKEIQEKQQKSKEPQVKVRYTENIRLLTKYENFDFRKWLPPLKSKLLGNHRAVLTVQGLFVETSPSVVFSFEKDEQVYSGAIWFIVKKQGFTKEQTGMFVDMLARYLVNEYGSKYKFNPRYCMAVDVFNRYSVNYMQLKNNEVPRLLGKALDEIKKLM